VTTELLIQAFKTKPEEDELRAGLWQNDDSEYTEEIKKEIDKAVLTTAKKG
jgi:hypothetical protein